MARHYRREYEMRLARARARGLSTAQAIGHAPSGFGIRELFAPRIQAQREAAYYQAVGLMAQGMLKGAALRQAGISAHSFNRYNRERGAPVQALYHYRDGQPTTVRGYQVASHGSTRILTAEGEVIDAPPVDEHTSSILGRHGNAVKQALHTGNPAALAPFVGVTIYTLDGQPHTLMTDLNDLHAFYAGMSEEEADDFDRTMYSDHRVIFSGPLAAKGGA